MEWVLLETELVTVVAYSSHGRTAYQGRVESDHWECGHDHELPMQAQRCARAHVDFRGLAAIA